MQSDIFTDVLRQLFGREHLHSFQIRIKKKKLTRQLRWHFNENNKHVTTKISTYTKRWKIWLEWIYEKNKNERTAWGDDEAIFTGEENPRTWSQAEDLASNHNSCGL